MQRCSVDSRLLQTYSQPLDTRNLDIFRLMPISLHGSTFCGFFFLSDERTKNKMRNKAKQNNLWHVGPTRTRG